MMFSIPLYFRVTEFASNTIAGFHLFPAVVGNAIGGLLTGRVIQRTGKYKALTIFATLSSSFTYSLLVIRWKGRVSFWESLEIVPGGFGTGIAGVATFIALTNAVEHDLIAVATGGLYLSIAIGMLTGLAISSSVQMSSLKFLLGQKLNFEGAQKVRLSYINISGPNGIYQLKSWQIIEKVVSDVGTIPGLEEPLQKIVVGSFVESLEYSHSKLYTFEE